MDKEAEVEDDELPIREGVLDLAGAALRELQSAEIVEGD
jgi:hypothetical protein